MERGQARFGLAIGVALALYCAAVLFAPQTAILALLSDDAFYYFKIADNIALGAGSTFDGIQPTNGYHPLWMLLMVGLFAFAWPDPSTPVVAVILINGVITALTLYGIYRLVDRHLAPGYGVVGAMVAVLPNLLTALTNGMETGLLLLATVGLLHLVYARRWTRLDAPPISAFFYGVGVGVLFLCRLDSVFIAIAACGLLVLGAISGSEPAMHAARRLGAFCAGFVLVAVPFFIWNVHAFGHLTPISGAIKSTAPVPRPGLALHTDMAFGAALLVVAVALVAVVTAAQIRREGTLAPALESPLVALTLACIGHFVHAFLFLSWGVYWWHFTLYGLVVALALPRAIMLAERTVPLPRRVVISMVVAGLLVAAFSVKAIELRSKAVRHGAWMKAAQWSDANLASDAIIGLKDAGLYGYFSRRRVVNLDGKANGYLYRDHLDRGTVTDYLDGAGVDYIADIGCRDHHPECWIVIPRSGGPPLVMKMKPEDQVYRGDPIPDRVFSGADGSYSRFVIWDFENVDR